jgi:hypothetical protein
MSDINTAKQKYARRTGTTGASNWNAAKGRMVGNYQAGLARFLGGAPNPAVVSAYRDGIDTAQYRGGDPDKWERNYLAKMRG